MKIAQYKGSYGTEIVLEFNEAYEDENSDYIRFSEVMDVKFTDLPAEVVVPQQVARIDRGIKGLRVELGQKIERLEDEKAKLLAITHEVSA